MPPYWFTGHPETVRAAEIKANRTLKDIGDLGGVTGTVFGEMRKQREDEIAADLADRKLGATLGMQEQTATQESAPTMPSSGAQANGGEPGPAAPSPNMPDALKPTEDDPQSSASPLQRLAQSTRNLGMKGLRAAADTAGRFGQAVGSMTGIGERFPDSTLSKARHAAALSGMVDREKMMTARAGALGSAASVSELPGAFIEQGTAIGQGHGIRGLSEFARKPDTGNEAGLTGWGVAAMMASPDPAIRARGHAIADANNLREAQGREPEARKTTGSPALDAAYNRITQAILEQYPHATGREVNAMLAEVPDSEKEAFAASLKEMPELIRDLSAKALGRAPKMGTPMPGGSGNIEDKFSDFDPTAPGE